jgi:phosphoribosylformylglycinamidine synthase
VSLFSESAGRAVVAVPRSEEVRFTDMCTARGFPHLRIGVTDGEGPDAQLDVQGLFAVPLSELREAWSGTLPAALG